MSKGPEEEVGSAPMIAEARGESEARKVRRAISRNINT